MKSLCCVVFIVFFANLQAQAVVQSKDWIDISQKSDDEIVRILEREVATLAESPADEASARVQVLQAQEKSAQQGFEQKRLLLEGEMNLAAAAREATQKAFTNLQTDSTGLAAQITLYERTQQRLRERLDKFPFKAVVVAKAAYTGNLEPVKEKMIYEAGRLAIEQVNGVKIIAETLVRNNILVSDIIQSTIEGKADCQPREWKTIEGGTRRVIYLYGIYDIYPLSAGTKLSGQAALLQLPVETYFISSTSETALTSLPANVQQEILTMLGTAEHINNETRTNLNTLVHQEKQLLESSSVTENNDVQKSKFETLKLQMNAKRQEMVTKRQAYELARKKLTDHLNSEQRIESVTQSDLERNRSQDVIKAQLMKECLTQFRTIVKTLYSQEKTTVKNFQLVESSTQGLMRQVRLQAAKVLGIYLSPSEGDIKYTASVAFRFGFEYASPATGTPAWRSGDDVPFGMVYIPAGAFLMGSNDGEKDEKPVHQVFVNAFYMDKYEVTVAQYQQFLNANPTRVSPENWGGQLQTPNHPVVYVSWDNANAYAIWAGKRLPTEAEWEYAARGGNTGLGGKPIYKYPWGNDKQNTSSTSLEEEKRWKETSPVGSFRANNYKLYDMAENVHEWCADWYDANYYPNSPERNPKGPAKGNRRVLRGGANRLLRSGKWVDSPPYERWADRYGINPSGRYYNVGFRCVQDAR